MNLKKYEEMKSKVDRLQRDVNRSEGALQQEMSRLPSFGCQTLDEAEVLLEKLDKELKEKEASLDAKMSAFSQEHQDLLG